MTFSNNTLYLLGILCVACSCIGNSSSQEKAVLESFVTERSGRDTRVLFVAPPSEHYNEIDSVRYSIGAKEATSYSDGSATRHHGIILRTISVSIEARMRKSYEKYHEPIVYRLQEHKSFVVHGQTIEPDEDELTITEDEKDYKCDSLYDYGSKVVGYFNSNQTITLDSFEKHADISIAVFPTKTIHSQPKK